MFLIPIDEFPWIPKALLNLTLETEFLRSPNGSELRQKMAENMIAEFLEKFGVELYIADGVEHFTHINFKSPRHYVMFKLQNSHRISDYE